MLEFSPKIRGFFPIHFRKIMKLINGGSFKGCKPREAPMGHIHKIKRLEYDRSQVNSSIFSDVFFQREKPHDT